MEYIMEHTIGVGQAPDSWYLREQILENTNKLNEEQIEEVVDDAINGTDKKYLPEWLTFIDEGNKRKYYLKI
jgi:hypothetical protein